MDTAEIITGLLYEHDCVIIPGIGALVAGYRPAEISFARKAIYPPSKSLVFNTNLRHDDGLLASGLAGAMDAGYDEAKLKVEKLAGAIRSALDAGEKYTLEGLGYFYTDNRRSILFHPEPGPNLMLDSYGLSFVSYRGDIRPLRHNKLRILPGGRSGDPDHRPLRKWAYVAAAGVLVVALSTMFWPSPAGDASMNSTSVDPLSAETAVRRGNAEDDAVTTGDNGMAGYHAPGLKIHHVIVGSYADFANARKQMLLMRGGGYAARVLFTGGEGYRVSVFSSTDKQESELQLSRVRSDMDVKAWLFTD